MKIASMTGIGRSTGECDGLIGVEIKSVNHRFKEIRCRLPAALVNFESDVRNKLVAAFKRGYIELRVNYQLLPTQSISAETIDRLKLITDLLAEKLNDRVQIQVGATDLFHDGINMGQEENCAALKPTLLALVDEAIENLTHARQEEGEKLKIQLLYNQSEYLKNLNALTDFFTEQQEGVKEKLLQKVKHAVPDFKIDEHRLLQEVVYYMEKMDIHEEIDRINIHTAKLSKCLENGGEVGRQLEFLLQELHRETNTIGSKSVHHGISGAVVQMKVALEKMREQTLNIE